MELGGLPLEHPHSEEAFTAYLVWLRANTRLNLNPTAFCSADIVEASNHGFDKMAKLEYNRLIRVGRRPNIAPVINFVVSFYLICTYVHGMSKIVIYIVGLLAI